jgi:hypothetical protein
MDRAALAGFLRRRREAQAGEGHEKLQLLAVLGQQRFAEAGPAS